MSERGIRFSFVLGKYVAVHGRSLDEQSAIADLACQLPSGDHAIQRTRFSPAKGIKIGLADLDVAPLPARFCASRARLAFRA